MLLFFFFVSFCQRLLKQPIMLPQKETTTDLPMALFLFGFANRVFQSPPHQIWNRNCSLISLEAVQGGRGRQTTSLYHSIMLPVFQWVHHKPPPPLIPPLSSRSPSIKKQVNMTDCMQNKKGEKNLMFQPGRHEFIPSILIMCIYRLLLPSLILRLFVLIIVHCFPLENQSLSSVKFEAWFASFCCFCCFAQSLHNHLAGPGRQNCRDNTGCVWICVCYSRSVTAACNRPSIKARQLAIRSGRGGCGMRDYAGGLVSYTISIRVACRLQSQCIRTALCLSMRACKLSQRRSR